MVDGIQRMYDGGWDPRAQSDGSKLEQGNVWIYNNTVCTAMSSSMSTVYNSSISTVYNSSMSTVYTLTAV
jgi:hypothetical protein